MLSAVLLLLAVYASADPYQDYLQQRAKLVAQEDMYRFDVNITLSPEEQQVNAMLLKQRDLEIAKMGDNFAPALNFVDAKPLIDQSPLLAVLRRMPKGGILHAHTGSIVDIRWIVSQVTYRNDCYIYYGSDPAYVNGSINIYRPSSPFPAPPSPGWSLVNDLRSASGNVTAFDQALYDSFMLGKGFPSDDAAWRRFQSLFAMLGALNYRPVFTGYLEALFESLTTDNVQYIELRVVMGMMWDDSGPMSMEQELLVYRDTVARYQQTHPGFAGAKVISCARRSLNTTVILNAMLGALDLYTKYPDLMLGFDLVGEEDAGYTTLYFVQDFLRLQPGQLPFYFHGGESYWASNENLVDVLLLGTRRIGHGFALDKHPLLMQMVRDGRVGIEVSPISNQQLVLENDMRNHPASVFVKTGVPFAICYDDPALYGYDAVSYDFWEGFMSWDIDLRGLKQLAINSITLSGMSATEQAAALDVFGQKWKTFITSVLADMM